MQSLITKSFEEICTMNLLTTFLEYKKYKYEMNQSFNYKLEISLSLISSLIFLSLIY